MFIDEALIHVAAGDGGNGCVAFRREKFVAHGGPSGGDGGDGGSIKLIADNGMNTLFPFRFNKRFVAKRGQHGMGSNCHGRNGEGVEITVPVGTLVKDHESGDVLCDLTEHGQSFVIVRGGKGGKGNSNFATSTNRAPREVEAGGEGEERWIILELKVIADVGLIGLPNAGKSTLLSRLTRAQPEIADYPFTTKHPNLGVVTIGDDRVFVLADLPGLIEGAHSGVGLGHEFLRHVERTRVLVHLVEPLPSDGSDPLANYHTICRELELHSALLALKPDVVAVTKAELTGSEEVRQKLEEDLGREVLAISAVTGAGLSKLVGAISATLAETLAGAVP